MPSLPAAPRCVKVEILGTLAGIPYANVLHFRKTADIVPGDVAALALALKTQYATSMLARHVPAFVFDAVRVTDLTSVTGEQATSASGAAGTSSGQPAPSSACQVITVLTATRSRSGRGRVFVGGLDADGMQDARNWTAGYTTAVSTSFTAVINAGIASGGAGTWQFGVLSYYSGVDPVTKKPILRGVPVFFPNTSLRISTLIETQRRRLGR